MTKKVVGNECMAYRRLLNDPWNGVEFSGRVNQFDDEMRQYYVYAHYDTADGCHPQIDWLRIPFYIGMGAGHRATEIHNRSREHLRRRLSIPRTGGKFEYGIVGRDLDCRAAMVLESKLIIFWGCIGKANRAISGLPPILVNKRYEAHPGSYNRKIAKKGTCYAK